MRRLDPSEGREMARLRAPQVASYAPEIALRGSPEIPAPRETEHDPSGRGYFDGGRPLAAISYEPERGVLDIHRPVVHPGHLRRAIARSLPERVGKGEAAAGGIVVSAASGSFPATGRYRPVGYAKAGEAEAAAGLRVAPFEKGARDG